MSSCVNGSNTQNLFYFKECIDKEKLISKILTNIESKMKLIEEYKNKYYLSNNILENIIMTKYEFLEMINEFEETITQSIQGMKSLIVEIRNLKEKKELELKLFKKRNKSKTIINRNDDNFNNLNNLCYDYSKDKNYSQYLDEYINKDSNNVNKQFNKSKNKSFCELKEISLYTNMYGNKNNLNLNNGAKNKIIPKKSTNNSNKNIPAIAIKKNITNDSKNDTKNDPSEIGSKNSNEDLIKLINNRNNNINRYKTYNKLKKTISNDSMTEKDLLTYDLSLINDLGKENQNQSNSIINNNDFKSFNNEPKSIMNRRILRLQLKNKNNNLNNDIQNKNSSFSQKYEIELQNTNQEKNEKIEVEIKYPIRQGIRQNCRKSSAEMDNSNNSIINRINYNKNKKEILDRINSNEKLKNYFAKKYGRNKYDIFLNKFWKNQININNLTNELNIISLVIQKEEKIEKLKNDEKKRLEENNKIKKISNKKNNSDYEFKFISKTPMQNIISHDIRNFRTITPGKNFNKKF